MGRTGVGVDYLAVCREACGEASEGASEVLQALEGVLSGHRTNFQFEYPCHSPTEQRWFLLQATGLEGKAGGAVVLHIDITERKLMEGRLLENERLRVLTTGLINGQEDERRRIARDLHDGLNQDIASLSIDLGMLAMKAANPIREEVQAIQRRTFDLSEQIRRISHELHPPALEHLGLEASLRTLCEQFERNATFQVVFHRSGSLPGLSPAAALGLYRVAQECLRNAAKHAAAEHVSVSIGASGGFLRMAIHDDGRGFDPHASAGLGLGLASIDERVRQLGGMLRLTSTSGDGTSVEVRIPIDGAGE